MPKTTEEAMKDGNNGALYEYYDKDGNKIGVGFLGNDVDPNSMVGKKITPTTDGKLWTPKDNNDIQGSISLNKETGNIRVSAPKAVIESPEFKQTFNEETLKKYSQAYKLNPDYKVSIEEKNEETGKVETKEITIPEYVEKINSSMENFISNYKTSLNLKDQLEQQYGKKAQNMSTEHIRMAFGDNEKATYIPNVVFGVNFFGDDPKKGNALKQLRAKLGENGEISVDELKKVYTRDEFGRSELAGLVAILDGTLQGANWAKDEYYEDEDGNQIYNRNSANEMAKVLAFRNFIVNNHPEGDWIQEAAGNIETFTYNAAYGTTRVFANAANFVSGGGLQDQIKDMDSTMEWYNDTQAMTSDATRTLQVLGFLGGTLLGSWGTGKIAGGAINLAGKGIGAATAWGTGLAYSKAGFETAEAAIKSGLSVKQAIDIAANAKNISKGAEFMLRTLNTVQKASLLTNSAKTFMEAHSTLDFATKFLLDTVHDAILYDSTTMIDALKASDQETRDYWMGQLADNSKWWAGMAGAKGLVKFAGKTTLGKAANAIVTPLVNKIAAKLGDTKQSIKNSLAGGDVVEDLKLKKQKAIDKGKLKKAERIQNQINAEEFSGLIRDTRRDLGNIKLDWDGIKLTEKSAEEFRNAMTRVKALENAVDSYGRNIDYVRQQMVGYQLDPSTGRKTLFINPTLGKANAKASNFYFDLAELGKKYNLDIAKDSLVSQNVTDYIMGRFHEKLMMGFEKYGEQAKAADATNALVTIRKNIDGLREELPEEITKFIDKGLNNKVYQKWYTAQNEYGVAKGLLDGEKIQSYEQNKIWEDSGYMPIVVKHESTGRWVEDSGRIDAVIDQDFKNLTFNVSEGQHYVDPELVRQSRMSNLAKAEVNAGIWKAYSGFGSNATNITKITGDQTRYVARLDENKKTLDKEIQKNAKGAYSEKFNVEIQKTKRRKPYKNTTVPIKTRSTIVSSMSPEQTTEYLVKKGVLTGPTNKLTDGVTEQNYRVWWNGLNSSERKYLQQQYSAVGKTTDDVLLGLTDDEIEKSIKASEDRISELRKQSKAGGTSPLENSIANGKPTSKGVQAPDKLESEISISAEKEKIKRYRRALENRDSDYTYLKQAIEHSGDDFEAGLQRANLIGDKDFAKSSTMNQAAKNLEDGKEAFYQGVFVAKMKGETRNILNVDNEALVDDLYATIKGQTEDYISNVIENEGARKTMDVMAETTDGTEDVARYIALRQLQEGGMDSVYKSLDDEIEKISKNKNLLYEDVELVKKKAHEMADEVIGSELDNAASSARTINPDLVDSKNIFDKQKALADDITKAEKKIKTDTDGYIMYLDDNGRQVYAEVDPAFSSLFNYRYKMDRVDAGILAKVNAVTSKLFRYGTTSVNLAAFGNQLFRDFGNAILVGGAWQTIKSNADNLVDVFGQNIVDQIKAFDPSGYEMKQVRQIAKETGQTIEEAAVSRELMRGAAISPTTTERTMYKDLMKQLKNSDSDTVLRNAQNKLQDFVDKWNPEELLNGKRENYLRNRVFASSYNDAMKAGYTVEQSRVYAEFAMNNATTNFSRQLYHMQAIADSTPYFRAAINGTKSFWRMWSLDPVGITGRVTGGLILPVMYLTGASLGSEENREVYKNIPDYQKEDSLVFVFNGRAMSIPLPQELSPIVAPFRQFVEYLYDANENDFWELMMNDVLGFFPYDFQGFTTIDMDKMTHDPTMLDRMGRGFSRLFSQLAPVPVKSIYMYATGTDPYSGKNLRDPSYSYWDDETDSVQTMDYNQNAFAKWFAKWFPNMSPYLAEKIISGVIGTTGSNLLGDIASFAINGAEEGWKTTLNNVGEQITKPFDVNQYDLVDSIWKREVRNLEAEKEAILNSNEMKVLLNKLAQEKDPEERKKISSQVQDLVNNYQQKVKSMVERLESEYGGNFDRKKFAAVVNLLNFNSDATYQNATQYSSNLSSEQQWNGRDMAIRTMQDMGIQGTEDMSIFGYLALDKEGNPVVKYNNPVAIMDMENQWDNQADIHLANIKALASTNDLWDRHEAIDQQVNAIYAKDKLTDSDYDQIDAIYVNWNAEVMAALAPYVERMTPEAAINNSKVLDYLDGLIEVPGDYKKDKYGRYVTNKKLGNGSANQAYIKNYIKNIFKVNDSGYSGGKNYSDRK